MKLLGEYLREEYGCKVYKLSLSAGVTCPNRDGRIGYGGCIFCSAGGSGEFAANADKSIPDQIEEAKLRVSKKIKGEAKYISYFQSYTNTYGDPDHLERIYREAIGGNDIVALSIGTRPDCISDKILKILSDINKIKPVWVELGLQTIHKRSAVYIRRGYDLSCYDEAVKRLKDCGLTVITHLILGLPGETAEDMKESVKYVVNSKVNGIKLQLLHILKGTDLEKEYYLGKVRVMEMDEYTDLLGELIPLIPDDVIIHRLTGDGDKKLLIAPLWSADKKKVLNAINKKLRSLE
ncbi:MAG: TIGR01212 family radical SAM protein [Lachnospiraceae bacterium]|nr:TIGR01212 family radical SAM protein [Lachnospiraceae bacterium]